MSTEEHISRIRAILNDKNLIARLPDGGEKLKERLEALMANQNNATNNNHNNSSTNTQDADSAVGTTTTTISNNNNQNSFGNVNRKRTSDEDGVSLITKGHTQRQEINNNSHQDASQKSATNPLDKALMKSFGDLRLGHLETIRLCRGISSDEAGRTGNKSLTKDAGLVDAKPLQILDWDETTNAHNEMLEEERQEELKRIRQRMELFAAHD